MAEGDDARLFHIYFRAMNVFGIDPVYYAMLYYNILYYPLLYYTILYYTILYYTIIRLL